MKKIVADRFYLIFFEITILLIIFGLLSVINIRALQKISFYLFGIWTLMCMVLACKVVLKKCNIRLDKKLYIYSGIVLTICAVIYTVIIANTKQIYTWDQCYYYNSQINLLENFDISFINGIEKIIRTTYTSDYGYFLLSFTSLIFSFTNKTEAAFILTFMLTEILPVIFVLLLNVINIGKKLKIKDKKIFIILSSLVLLVFPLLHKAALTGQPDIFGLFWVGLIVLLTTNYKFEERDIGKWCLIIIFSYLLAITRRWYIFWMLGYYISYGMCLLAEAVFDKDKELFIKKLKNALLFVFISIIILIVLLFPIIQKTIISNYSVSYSSWNIGGISHEIKQQYEFLGILSIIVIAIGSIYWILKKETRYFTTTFILAYILILILFTRIQNTWYHQSLIFVPQYLILIILGIGAICQIDNKYIKYSLSTIILIYLITAECGEITESKLFFDNKLYSNISIKPEYREDYEKVGEMVDFIKSNCKIGQDYVYPNFATSRYCGQTLSQYLMPDTTLRKMVLYESSVDAAHGFPLEIFYAKYVIIPNQILDETGAVKSKTIPAINKAILETPYIEENFKKVKEFDMGNGIIFYFYQRLKITDKIEAEIWKKLVEEQSTEYPKLFEERIDAYITRLK